MRSTLASNTRICVVAENPPTESETFIRDHLEKLPAQITLIHGWQPTVGNRTVLSLPQRAVHKGWGLLTGNGIERELTAAYVKAFARYRPAAVLAEYGSSGARTTEACRRLTIPLIVHFHGYDASVHSVLQEYAEAYTVMFHNAAALIAVSQAMVKKLVSLGAPATKVHYNPYGIDCLQFGGVAPAEAPPVFVAVGRFVEKKGPQLTLSAFAEVHRANPDARLRMVGGGPLLDECRELAVKLGIADVVRFLGVQKPAVIQEEMRSARCFVQHSVEAANGDCEGTPVSILEAGASGLPVVATRHAGIPDAVIEGETGFLVAEHDVAGMANQMLQIAQSPQLAAEMGNRARQRIAQHFSQERSLGRLWSIIESCIANNAAH
jgi:colanic acid/amylovoran biosynthesis glycosyltransferase